MMNTWYAVNLLTPLQLQTNTYYFYDLLGEHEKHLYKVFICDLTVLLVEHRFSLNGYVLPVCVVHPEIALFIKSSIIIILVRRK